MHYLIHGAAFTIVEDAAQARKYVAAGWQRASRADVMARWRARDRAALARLRTEAQPAALEELTGWKLRTTIASRLRWPN